MIYHCKAPFEVRKRRLMARVSDISDATVAIMEEQEKRAEPFREEEQQYVRMIDNS
jgi:predicted kinase